MPILRRTLLQFAAAALPIVPHLARAQSYPTRPVRIVVGFTPGGSTDIVARLTGQWLSTRLGQPFVIENRPGAGAMIAAETVVRAPADGHTLLLVSSADIINGALHRNPSFDFLRDITPVASITRQPQLLLAHPSFAAKSLPELIAYAKSNPGKIAMASPGNGTIGHLAGELLKMMAGVEMVHVPYRGASPALTDLLAGHVQVTFTGLAGSIEYVKSGRLLALAVTTATRSQALPDTPAAGEFVSGYEAVSLFGIGAPRNTDAEVVDKLNQAVGAALVDPEIDARIADLGGTALANSPSAFGKVLVDETEKWARVIRAAHIQP